MGKGLQKYTKGKGLRWKKGDSCVSNPTNKTHRVAARRSFFQLRLGEEQDTFTDRVSKLSLSNEAMGTTDRANSESSSVITGGSLRSDISAWTQCSIQSFSRLQSIWSTNSVLHREMLAILAAVTEVIKERNGRETETEYFAALMTVLESVESMESLTAVLSLLNLLIKRVPANVIRKQSAQIVKPLVKILSDNISTENNSLLRSVLKCLTIVLRVQDLAAWKESSTTVVYRMILSLLNHHKPKVRKQCQSSICSILKGSDIMMGSHPASVHPLAGSTAEFCIQLIEQTKVSKDATVTLHVLGLLKDILSDFPAAAMKASIEAILKCMLVVDPLVTTVGLKALNGLFRTKPPTTRLDFELNVQLINAIYDFQPPIDDSQLTFPWLETMKNAHINLFRLSEEGTMHLPRYSAVCMKILSSSNDGLRSAAADALKEIINIGLKDVAEKKESYAKYLPQIQRSFVNIENGLSYQYHGAWNHVLQLLAAFYDVSGSHGSNYLTESLIKLAELRSSANFSFTADLDYAFSRAIRKIGPAKILAKVQLDFRIAQTPMNLTRSWMIPLLRDNVQDSQIGYFVKEILPLAIQLRSKSVALSAAGENTEAKACGILSSQIWSLLPGFCIHPTDLLEKFKDIAQPLGETLVKRMDLRLDIMAALRNLVLKSLNNEPYCAELAKYAKNYIPILLNIYTDEEAENAGVRLAALETVKVYLKIAPKELIVKLLEDVIVKMSTEGASTFTQQACLDIAAALLPYSPETKLDSILNFCRNAWTSKDHSLQKKGYRFLEELLVNEQKSVTEYVQKHLPMIKKVLVECGYVSKSPSKSARLRCLCCIIKSHGDKDKDWIKSIFPEVVLGTKEVSTKARQVAFDLIKQIGSIVMNLNSRPVSEGVSEFFEWILSGFVGTPEGISASLLALSHAVFEFSSMLPKELINMLLENTSLLFASKSREIIQNVFGFLKVAISQFEDVQLGHHLPALISSVSEMDDNFRRSFRTKIKEIFGMLIKKFGYSMIIELVPEEDHKLLNNIRKTDDRRKKKKREKREIKVDSAKNNGAESTSERSRMETVTDILDELVSSDEEIMDREPQARKSKFFITEEDEYDIVDFTDPKASQKITSKAGQRKRQKLEDAPVAPDGRIIISDDKDSDDERDDTLLASKRMETSQMRKKNATNDDDNESEYHDQDFKYKAGGSGIHRQLKSDLKKGVKPKKLATGEEYRAKKAGGDIKRKGRPDPYAYIPLNHKVTNKRKRAKISGQFNGIIRKAKKGAAKGSRLSKKRVSKAK